jgi:hypothetical protein
MQRKEEKDHTLVRIERSVHDRLRKARLIDQEPLSDCVKRLLDEHDQKLGISKVD